MIIILHYNLIDSSAIQTTSFSRGSFGAKNIFIEGTEYYTMPASSTEAFSFVFYVNEPIYLSEIDVASYSTDSDNKKQGIKEFKIYGCDNADGTNSELLYSGIHDNVGKDIFTKHYIAIEKIKKYQYYRFEAISAYTELTYFGYQIQQLKIYSTDIKPKYYIKDNENNYYIKQDGIISSVPKDSITKDNALEDIDIITTDDILFIGRPFSIIRMC